MSGPSTESEMDLQQGLAAFYNSKLFSDVTVRCQNTTYYLHKIILCYQSKFFMKALSGGFKESKSGVVELEDDPPIVETVLHYLYNDDFSDKGELPRMIFNAKVYALADKYGIPTLKDLALKKFEEVAEKDWKTKDFPATIKVIYESTPSNDRGLRDAVVQLAAKHSDVLLLKNEAFENMMVEVPEFGKDLVYELNSELKQRPVLKRYRCFYCQEIWQTDKVPTSSYSAYYCYQCGKKPTWSKLE